MRVMGIDYGDARIGVAVSDSLGWGAHGVETIKWNGNLDKVFDRIHELVEEHDIHKIVVGFPVNMNGTVGPRGEKTMEFIELLSKKVNCEIIKWDERLTTVAANRTMHEIGLKASKKKGLVDQIAAVFILQGYLDSIRMADE